MKKILPVLIAFFMCLLAFQVMAQTYVPITVTSGFNKDLIANGSGTAAGTTDVPGGFDGGAGNVYYGSDFVSTITGTPASHGCPTGLQHSITSPYGPVYNIPSFGSNNCLYMQNTGDGATLYFSGSGSYQRISLLAASANHPLTSAIFDATVNFSDGTNFTTTFAVADWVVPAGTYYIALSPQTGRVAMGTDVFNECGATKLFDCTIDLTGYTTKVVTSIYCHKTSTSAQRCAIFAVCGVTATGGPLAVIADAATSIGTFNFDANWHPAPSDPNPPTSYRLDVSTNSSFTSFVPGYNNLDVGDVTTATVTGLSASTTYYYRVRGVNASGVGPSSDPRLATTINNAPLPITATDADPVLGTKFDAHWSPTSPDPNPPTSYRLDVATDLGFSNILPAYNNLNVGNVTTFTVEGLTILSTYYYRVRGVNSNGTTASSNVITVHTTNGLPPAPVATPATAVIQINFWAHWNAGTPTPSEPVDCYYLDVATDIGFSNILPAYNNLNVGLNTMFKITGLTAGTTYYYRVRAHNEYGLSDNSNVITVITVPSNIPTLSEWGLIILGLVLLGAGTLYITRWHS